MNAVQSSPWPGVRMVVGLMHRILSSLVLSAQIVASGLAIAEASPQVKTPTPESAPAARRPLKPEAEQAMARAQELLFRKNNPEGSIAEFKKVIKIDPWYGQGYLLLGVAYMQLQKWSEAQLAFDETTKVEPGNAQAYLGLGSALNEQKDYPEAQKALEHSLDLQPNSAEAHYELARTFGAMGKWDAAGPHARRAIDLNPDYPGSHALMGNVYLEQDDLESALKEFRIYLQMAPQGSLVAEVQAKVKEIEEQQAKSRH